MKLISLLFVISFSVNAFGYVRKCTVSYRAGTPEVTAEIRGEGNDEFTFSSFDSSGYKVINSAKFIRTDFGYVEVTRLIPKGPARAFFHQGDLQIARYSKNSDGSVIHVNPYGHYRCF